MAVGDFNGDGKADLAVANNGTNTMGVLLSTATGNFTGQVYTIPGVTWTGATSTNWGTASNWSGNAVPLPSDNVLIPGAPANQPVLDTARTVHNLTLLSGASLSLAGQNFTVNGTFTNQGTLQLQGNETVQLTQDNTEGTWMYVGDGTGATLPLLDFGAADYFNLVLDDTHANKDTFQATAALAIGGQFQVLAGTYAANGQTTTVSGLTTVDDHYLGSTALQTLSGGLTLAGGSVSTTGGGSVLLGGGLSAAPAIAPPRSAVL